MESNPSTNYENANDATRVKYFKATKQTKRFNKNQRVWITTEFANHLYIKFKYRGKGRYVNGVADKFAKYVGEIKTIEVEILWRVRADAW